MSIDTPAFLSIFLPVLVLLHAVIPGRMGKNLLLLLAGLLFCACGSISGVAVLISAVACNYLLAKLLRYGRKWALPLGIALNLALLGTYKYLGFFTGGLLTVPRAVPLGISFAVFKLISWLADCSRGGEIGSFGELLLYVTFFPELTAGPLSRFGDFRPQLHSRCADAEGMALGFRRFVAGLGKKLLLAAPMAEIADGVFPLGASASVTLAWLGAAAFMLQIYFDFSGYSDMALGLGRMFGFSGPENFRAPYLAASITDFWRRWHMSLSGWFRDYVYIPLGGSRRGKTLAARNKLIVFLLCGLWHGAGWTFLLWGLWHGILAAAETLFGQPKNPIIGRIYTLLAVGLGFVLFRAADLASALGMLAAMFGGRGSIGTSVLLHSFAAPRYLVTFGVCLLACFPWGERFRHWERNCPALRTASFAVSLLLLVLCLAAMAAQGFRPFIYAQF